MLVKRTNSTAEFNIIRLFSLSHPPSSLQVSRHIVVHWLPPIHDCIKINVDGSTFGNPSCGAIGVVFRD